MKEETIISAITTLLCLTSLVPTSIGDFVSGVACSYAGPYIPSDCKRNNNNGTHIILVSDALWDNGNACGRNYGVWCKPVSEDIFQHCTSSNGYVVAAVGYCGHCNGCTMLLSKEVFSALTSTHDGEIQIKYLQSNV